MTQVRIIAGSYRDQNQKVVSIHNQVASLIQPYRTGARGGYVVVQGSDLTPARTGPVRVRVQAEQDVVPAGVSETDLSKAAPAETEAQAIERIRERFQILDTMTDATASGVVRGLIVSGPPGVGKSFGVERILEQYEAQHRLQGGIGNCTEVVKGAVTPIGLYQTLYNNSSSGNIVVFDDCDSVLLDDLCLNMLKAVLDSGKKRTVSWRSESAALRREGIPDRFDFRGGVIFITNLCFDNVRSAKLRDHLAALQSRCHYLDLGMNSQSDCILRIQQIVQDGMLDCYRFSTDQVSELVQFITDNTSSLREVSLRMVLKIADLRKMSESNWQNLARATCMRG